jgi:hypothetical protein
MATTSRPSAQQRRHDFARRADPFADIALRLTGRRPAAARRVGRVRPRARRQLQLATGEPLAAVGAVQRGVRAVPAGGVECTREEPFGAVCSSPHWASVRSTGLRPIPLGTEARREEAPCAIDPDDQKVAGGDSCLLAMQQSWATAWRVRSLLVRTKPSSGRHATRSETPAAALICGRLHRPGAHACSGRPTSAPVGRVRTSASPWLSSRHGRPVRRRCRSSRGGSDGHVSEDFCFELGCGSAGTRRRVVRAGAGV